MIALPDDMPPHDEALPFLMMLVPPLINRLTPQQLEATRDWLLLYAQCYLKPTQALMTSSPPLPDYLAVMGRDTSGTCYVLYGETIYTGEYIGGSMKPLDMEHIETTKRHYMQYRRRRLAELDDQRDSA
jgi:hypothetical protein